MADREQARERSDATARALKGSLSSVLGKGLVCSYMPSVGLKEMRQQKAVARRSPCLASCCCTPTSLILPPTLPGHPGWLQRREHVQGAKACTPTPLLGCVSLRDDSTHCPSLTCCLSTTLSFPGTERQPLSLTFPFTQPLLQLTLEHSLPRAPIDGCLLAFMLSRERNAPSLSSLTPGLSFCLPVSGDPSLRY